MLRWGLFLFLLAGLLSLSCGSRRQVPLPDDDDQPIPQEPPASGEDTWGDVQPLLSSFCSECHSDAVFMSTQKGFMGSKAPLRLQNKSMPPSYAKNFGKWTSADRQRLIDFIEANQ